jgi:DNA-binding MarR family transcriptional regulator
VTTPYQRLGAFRHALRKFLHFSEAACERAGITAQQYHALLVLRAAARGPMTVNELAAQLVLKHNSAVGLVDRLAEQRLLVRRPARDDARKVHLALTPRGRRVIERLAAIHLAELSRAGGQIALLLQDIANAS